MFPGIFDISLKNLGRHLGQAAFSFIVMEVVWTIFPLIGELIANYNIAQAYYLPIVCYFVIFLSGIKFYQVRTTQKN